MLFQTSDGLINNYTLSTTHYTQTFHQFCKNGLSPQRDMRDPLNRPKAMDGAEPVSFGRFLHPKLKSTEMHWSQGLTVLQQYLHGRAKFSYDAIDQRSL